jgi:hypothetical protein
MIDLFKKIFIKEGVLYYNSLTDQIMELQDISYDVQYDMYELTCKIDDNYATQKVYKYNPFLDSVEFYAHLGEL